MWINSTKEGRNKKVSMLTGRRKREDYFHCIIGSMLAEGWISVCEICNEEKNR